jgi:hypothetical protein
MSSGEKPLLVPPLDREGSKPNTNTSFAGLWKDKQDGYKK